jgi:predicted TIM-barrel fold metal-dependent hydrolase
VALVSSDGHAGTHFENYRSYLDPAYRAAFDDYEASLAAFYQQLDPLHAVADERNEVAERCRFTDPRGRLEDLEANGVVSEVLFPGASPATSPPWSDFLSAASFRGRTPRQRELQQAGERAYNRWLAEFCQSVPTDRFLGLALLPFWDMETAVDDVEWAAEQGLRGVLLPFMNYDVPEYVHEWYWDPFWAACEEHGLSINFHGGNGQPELGRHEALHSLDHGFFARRCIAHLIVSGVFDRFPTLHATMTESLASWVPDALRDMDASWHMMNAQNEHKPVLFRDNAQSERPPSTYWGPNFFIGVSVVNLYEMQQRYEIGVDTMMYGLDYPHPEGPWGQSRTWMQASLGKAGVNEEEARKILGENAARLYHVDLDVLAPVVERVGPTLDEVLQVPADDEVRGLLDEMRTTGRELAAQQFAIGGEAAG